MHKDLRDDAIDLRHDDGRVARFERGDIFGRVVHFCWLRRFDLHRHGWWRGGLRAFVSAAAGG